jgi:hypothetical protein
MNETFKFFNDEWNEPTTNTDNRGDNYHTDFEQGVDEYVHLRNDRITFVED